MKIKKDDTVLITTGRDKGRTGKVLRVYSASNKVLVEGLNMVKKNVPKSEQMPQGGIVDVARPIHASNLMVIDPKTKKPARVGYEIKDGKKVRIFKKSKMEKIAVAKKQS